ncbi:hypothetical protein [Actinoplanes regularis]|uniref:hypothetical protein n=1 Tax=Actinoplanes regularis TaxID=52697 RepID=UPI0015C5DFB8|nr:hypothetical protein [Actinoplanes regularis]GIE86460.1 hypothetical protein Are01nite_29400 [Actinoplanes regularis]
MTSHTDAEIQITIATVRIIHPTFSSTPDTPNPGCFRTRRTRTPPIRRVVEKVRKSTLIAATAADYSHVSIDGTIIETDRCTTEGPTTGIDFDGIWIVAGGPGDRKNTQSRWNIQIVTVPDGRPIWTAG